MMLAPFFSLAAVSPGRQRVFRQAVVSHLVVMAGAVWAMQYRDQDGAAPFLGYVLLTAGIVEGAVLLGWRLTQMPKSQALEFLLVSPIQPREIFIAEAGHIDQLDLAPLLLMPFTWGAISGLGLVVWAYEPQCVRRWGERGMLG